MAEELHPNVVDRLAAVEARPPQAGHRPAVALADLEFYQCEEQSPVDRLKDRVAKLSNRARAATGRSLCPPPPPPPLPSPFFPGRGHSARGADFFRRAPARSHRAAAGHRPSAHIRNATRAPHHNE
jgi:hypothetical protein